MHPDVVKKIADGKPTDDADMAKVASLWNLVSKENQTAYVVTSTVDEKLGMLKVKRNQAGWFDWTVFSEVKECKKTFILYPAPEHTGGACLRAEIGGDKLYFCFLKFNFKDKQDKINGEVHWTIFHIDRKTNEHDGHCSHKDTQEVYEFVYKILCFIFLSDNDYEVLKPGAKSGTKKNGKIINDLPVPVTIINSKWNITTIRTEGFDVSPHFALRRCGPGRTASRIVFIEQFRTKGSIRGAATKELDK